MRVPLTDPNAAVLVIETQAMRRDLLALLLRRLRYRVELAASLDEARKTLRTLTPDLVLLGCASGQDDRLGFAAELRRRKPPLDAPIVVFGAERTALSVASEPTGVTIVHGQPPPIDRLLRTVRRVLLERAGFAMMETTVEIIDLRHLDSFTEGDVGLERELAALFLGSAESCVQRMRAALVVPSAAGDWPAAAHALKGAAANLGARQVAACAHDLEAMPPEAEGLARLTADIDAVRRFFAARPC